MNPLIPRPPRHQRPRRAEPPRDSSLAPGNRPTEVVVGIAGTVGAAVATLIGVTDPEKYKALVVLLSWLPYGVTWLVRLLKTR